MPEHITTRFAPSPTGFMHIGGVRTALFAYLFARKHNGTFILRIEDTDKAREVAGSIEHIQEALTWMGIEWDYGPETPGPFGSCIQSQRLDTYKKYAQILIDKGLAYPDPYTQEEVAAFREKAESEKRPFLFRNHRPEVSEQWDGTKPLRLKAPYIKRYSWHDEVRGTLSAGEEMVDDVIIIKADGYPTYNFAHIIDDHEMGVTHIMRGDEFISSMPKFLSIYDALGFSYPKFVTLPPILRDDRTKKLGKRDGAKDIMEYKTEGYLAPVMLNFLALIGWNPGTKQEIFSASELIKTFSVDKIQKSGGAFNDEKLDWMNKEYLSLLSTEDYLDYIMPSLSAYFGFPENEHQERWSRAVPLLKERIHHTKELTAMLKEGEFDFIVLPVAVEADKLKWKNDADATLAGDRLVRVLALLEDADFRSQETIKSAIWQYVEETGRGEVLWPLRVALSGRERSPDPFTCAFILGKEETCARVKNACAKIEG
jgi:glutamyl-tRNA synthetase